MNVIPFFHHISMETEEPLADASVSMFDDQTILMPTEVQTPLPPPYSELPPPDNTPPPPYDDAPPPYYIAPLYDYIPYPYCDEQSQQMHLEPIDQFQDNNLGEVQEHSCQRRILCERVILSCVFILIASFLSFFSAIIGLSISHDDEPSP
ncbi:MULTISPECIES: hypothetical protein [Candidatus Ichthyocystis]|uniref:Putative membrane protein n=1 Tax=Candidatus Ichthyocystis hellenicum TaxID=1561003 RepID=A0A0S4M0Q6_9BURK|nr:MULTISPECIES: hypothetical protein [Ichthyocystis]CUT17185.1 putative membrane protein [Candidatus Ichthyocystis hellenicum]